MRCDAVPRGRCFFGVKSLHPVRGKGHAGHALAGHAYALALAQAQAHGGQAPPGWEYALPPACAEGTQRRQAQLQRGFGVGGEAVALRACVLIGVACFDSPCSPFAVACAIPFVCALRYDALWCCVASSRRVAAGDGLRGVHRALLLRGRDRRQARVSRLPGPSSPVVSCAVLCVVRPLAHLLSRSLARRARHERSAQLELPSCAPLELFKNLALVVRFAVRPHLHHTPQSKTKQYKPHRTYPPPPAPARAQAVANTLVTPLSTVAFSSVALMGASAQPLTPLTIVAIVVIPLGIVIFKWEDFTKEREENILSLIARH